MKKSIAVIIPTFNRVDRLKACVKSILNSEYSSDLYSIYVIDDGSTDETQNYLKKISSNYVNVHILTQEHGGPGKARNLGISACNEELVAFTDDDCEVDSRWLLELNEVFQDEDVMCVGGSTLSSHNSLIPKYMGHIRALDPIISFDGKVKYIVTSNACIRRKILVSLGGFDETFPIAGGEDSELSLRLRSAGYALLFKPQCRVLHHYETSSSSFLNRYYRYGLGCRMAFDLTGNQEMWFSDAAGKIFKWLNGEFDIRCFSEVKDIPSRSLFSVLHMLNRMMLYAGYLHIKSITDLDSILSHNYYGNRKIDLDRAPNQSATIELLTLIEEPDVSVSSYKLIDLIHTGCVAESIKHILSFLDFDLVLKIALGNHVPELMPSSPDVLLTDGERLRYIADLRSNYREFNKRCIELTLNVISNSHINGVSDLEDMCINRKIDLNSFAEWFYSSLLKGHDRNLIHCSEQERLKIIDALPNLKSMCGLA